MGDARHRSEPLIPRPRADIELVRETERLDSGSLKVRRNWSKTKAFGDTKVEEEEGLPDVLATMFRLSARSWITIVTIYLRKAV